MSFVTDLVMQDLNLTYRGKDRPTDVLSFSLIEGKGTYFGDSLGDIVISFDTARDQAREYGVTISEEITRLLIHGILHLCGYDHERVPPRIAARMRRKEAQLRAFVTLEARRLVVVNSRKPR